MSKDHKKRSRKKTPQIPVIAVGKGWLVVDKPAGLTVHNAPGYDLCARVKELLEKKPEAAGLIEVDPKFGINPVHRLDKETSGLVLLAADPESFMALSRQFESRQIRKVYMAVLHGLVEKPADGEWGVWEKPLSKAPGGRENPQGGGEKQPCTTRYKVLEYSEHYTMVEIELLSGRKHQIRRHAKLAGHPVVGDDRYGSMRAIKYLRENAGFYRLALHSFLLTFTPPDSKTPKTIKAKEIPPEIKTLFEADRKAPAK